MDKVSKLNKFYNLVDAQGIQVVVKIGTLAPAPIPLQTTVPSPISVIRDSPYMREVDLFIGNITTLAVKEETFPLISTKRAREEE